MTGLTVDAASLPTDPCGAGSTLSALSGDSVLLLADGVLGAGGSCLFAVTLDVPIGAVPDTYLNTTSSVSGTMDGAAIGFESASAALVVASEVPELLKEFTDDPVGPGGSVTLEFTITNPSPINTATHIEFTDDLDAALTGLEAIGLPVGGICGLGSEIAGTGSLLFTEGTLLPGASCTFAVTLAVPGAAQPGEYVNVTSGIEAEVSGLLKFGDPAQGTLEVRFDLGLTGLPEDISVEMLVPEGLAVGYTTPGVTDPSNGATVGCMPLSGSLFPIGETSVTCTARNDAGDTHEASFLVEVFVLCGGKKATIWGTDGADVLVGTALADVIVAFAGDDFVNGLAGNDYLCGGRGHDEVNGRDGNDHLFGERGDDLLRGGAGADVIDGGIGNDQTRDGPGADVVIGGIGNDRFIDDSGADDYTGGGGAGDRIDLRNATTGVMVDLIAGEVLQAATLANVLSGIEQVRGSKHDDTLQGSSDDNVLLGSNGNDTLAGRGGDDILKGNKGDDTMRGGGGDDLLIGAGGDDVLPGNADEDIVLGGPGDDIAKGGSQNDTVDGGGNSDRVFGNGGTDTVNGGAGLGDVCRSGELGFVGCEVVKARQRDVPRVA